MKKMICLCALLFVSTLVFSQPPAQNPAPIANTPQSQADDLIKQGRKLHSDGKLDDALAVYQKAMAIAPDYYDVHIAIGAVLDIKGQYDEARKHLSHAVELADDAHKSGALRSLAMSYAFECKTADVEKYERQAEQMQITDKKYDQTAGILNELGRIDLDCGQIDKAYDAYKEGFLIADKTMTKPEDKDLWNFRWEHAQARLEARRGHNDEAQKHVAAAKAIWAKKTLPEAQAIYVPYLTGYVAFYGGDYKTALADFQKSDTKDPFNLAMLAQTEEKLGDKAAAKNYWTQVWAIYSRNPPNAYGRPLAKKALGM